MAFWPFGKREIKESRAGAALVLTPGQPAWSGRDYRAFATEGYTQNAVAYKAISSIADAVASVPWLAFRGETELSTHPVLDLLRKPNPFQTADDYMRAKISFYLIAGNGYEERVSIGKTPRELYQLRPDRMRVIPSAMGVPMAYEYVNAGRTIRWDVDGRTGLSDIRHLRAFNPVDDWYGLSPIEAVAFAVDQHNAGMAWMQALLQNSARPSGALIVPADRGLTDDQFHRLKAEMEGTYSGAKNAGRPMLLEGGMDWKAMGLSPTDMGIIESINASARTIALGLGIPPQLLGIPGDNTYSNYEQARLAFWEDTIIPLLYLIAGDWSEWLGMGEIRLEPDLDQIPAIVDKRRTLWAMAEASTVLTINEKRELMGFDSIAGGDVLMVSGAQIPLELAIEPPAPPPPMLPPPGNGVPPELTPDDVKAWVYGSSPH
jgi:HK97 family phage portal protein